MKMKRGNEGCNGLLAVLVFAMEGLLKLVLLD
jgi:hypothetical protein